MNKAIEASVQGKVQGVSYRAFVREQALVYQACGHAINQPDGSVSVYLESSESNLQKLIAKLQQGPRHASVDNVEWRYIKPLEAKGFRIS